MNEPEYVYEKGRGWILQTKPKRIRVAGNKLRPGDKIFRYSYNGSPFYEDWPYGVVIAASDIASDYSEVVGTLSGYMWEIER